VWIWTPALSPLDLSNFNYDVWILMIPVICQPPCYTLNVDLHSKLTKLMLLSTHFIDREVEVQMVMRLAQRHRAGKLRSRVLG
jgi:hypothetical protein